MALESKYWAQANELGTLPIGTQSERERSLKVGREQGWPWDLQPPL